MAPYHAYTPDISTALPTVQDLSDAKVTDITKIEGLENLLNIQKLNLQGNPIRGNDIDLLRMNAQEVVKYCQEK